MGACALICIMVSMALTGMFIPHRAKMRKKMGACALRCTLCVMETVLLLVFVIFTSSSSFDLIHLFDFYELSVLYRVIRPVFFGKL